MSDKLPQNSKCTAFLSFFFQNMVAKSLPLSILATLLWSIIPIAMLGSGGDGHLLVGLWPSTSRKGRPGNSNMAGQLLIGCCEVELDEI